MSKIINFRKETLKNKAIKLGLQIKPNGNFVPTEGLGLTDLLVTSGQVWTGFLIDLMQLKCSANVIKQGPAKLCAQIEAKSRCRKKISSNIN